MAKIEKFPNYKPIKLLKRAVFSRSVLFTVEMVGECNIINVFAHHVIKRQCSLVNY